MKMKVSGFDNIEFNGDIERLHEFGGCLEMGIRLNTPVGWHATASLSHKDLLYLIRLLLLSPANLCYLFFGFGKPKKS